MTDFEAKMNEIKTIYGSAATVASIWDAPDFVREWLAPSCFIGHSVSEIESSLIDLEPSCPQDATEEELKRCYAAMNAYQACMNAVEASKEYDELVRAVRLGQKPSKIERLERGISANVCYASSSAKRAVELLMESIN